jgi:pilus assembly protein Flp/PilA
MITKMGTLFIRFVHDESAVTAIEYGLIGSLISVAIITAVTVVGTSLQAVFTNITALLAP